eukprot:1931354-Amphidinium_carterae.2
MQMIAGGLNKWSRVKSPLVAFLGCYVSLSRLERESRRILALGLGHLGKKAAFWLVKKVCDRVARNKKLQRHA